MRGNAPSTCEIILVGNKTDLIESIEVSKRMGEQSASDNGIHYFFETSARENTGIQELFRHIATEAYNRSKANVVRTSLIVRPSDHIRKMEAGEKEKETSRCSCSIF